MNIVDATRTAIGCIGSNGGNVPSSGTAGDAVKGLFANPPDPGSVDYVNQMPMGIFFSSDLFGLERDGVWSCSAKAAGKSDPTPDSFDIDAHVSMLSTYIANI